MTRSPSDPLRQAQHWALGLGLLASLTMTLFGLDDLIARPQALPSAWGLIALTGLLGLLALGVLWNEQRWGNRWLRLALVALPSVLAGGWAALYTVASTETESASGLSSVLQFLLPTLTGLLTASLVATFLIGLTRSGLEILVQREFDSSPSPHSEPIAPADPAPIANPPPSTASYKPPATHYQPSPLPNDLPPATAWLGVVVIVGLLGMLYYGVTRRK